MDTRRPVWASRVLLVDDYPDSAESMALVLKVWGYLPLVAFDGPTGLELALTQRPDVIFLEISLPGMNGLEVARRIRAEPGMEKTPLLALTGYGQVRDKQASRAAGFDRHLVKPVDPGELRPLLAELVTGRNCQPAQCSV
jgi:CheY-like chemotaxis protein